MISFGSSQGSGERGLLDSVGRWYLETLDYRIYGLLILVVLCIFFFWRRWRYKSLPSRDDYFTLVINLVGVFGGVTIFVVFLLTKPPAFEVLPSTSLVLIGLLVPIVILGFALPRLRALFFPAQAPRPPESPGNISAE